MKWVVDKGTGLLKPASTEEDAVEAEMPARPNRAMIRGGLRAARKHGAGYTRAMRKGRKGS